MQASARLFLAKMSRLSAKNRELHEMLIVPLLSVLSEEAIGAFISRRGAVR
jgi:hypothetical protein